MASKSSNEEEIATYIEAYYEELAYEEEIYLEEIEEELRAYLLSLVTDSFRSALMDLRGPAKANSVGSQNERKNLLERSQ